MHYKKWLQENLIPNLESKSVIVADIADDDDCDGGGDDDDDDDTSESS